MGHTKGGKRLAPEKVAAAFQAYLDGATYEEAGALVGCTGAAIRVHARRRGISLSRRRGRREVVDQERLDALVAALAQPRHRTMRAIFSAAGVTPSVICGWRKKVALGVRGYAACAPVLMELDRYADRRRRPNGSTKRDPRKGPFVYFIRAEGVQRVKIGFSQHSPSDRLQGCLTGSPIPLHLIGAVVVPGQHIERWLHVRFDKAWSHGEWFNLTPQLQHEIDLLILHGRVEDAEHAARILDVDRDNLSRGAPKD